ncbi:MAG: MFS transporter [Leptolyngbya sp. PLA3]|nr:MAG: MFS transporter [Cyanobacteria bacterium CYA]MCE7968669.1 MFS transporter [Leptolyngbya sp. PL-A3]
MSRRRTRFHLQLSTMDALLFTVMVGCGEAYIGAFALAIGLSEVQVGLIGPVPLLIGAVLQLLTPRGVRLFNSHKHWVILCTGLQAATFLPLMFIAWQGAGPAWLVFLAAGLYWGANLATGPAWNTWIGTVVPKPVRARYFARRTRIAQFGLIIGLVATGLLLRSGDGNGQATLFLLPFGVAMLARFACVFLHAGITESRPIPTPDRRMPIRELVFGQSSASGGRLLVYMLCVQATCNVAAPFFTPFLLGELEYSYPVYAIVLVAAFMGKVLALPFLGRISQKFGPRALLWSGGIGIVPLAGVWALTSDPVWLVVIQVIAGFAWATYELATFLLLFDTIPPNRRTGMLTLYNLLNAICVTGGAAVGAALLHHSGKDMQAYHLIFLVGSGARLMTVPILLWVHVPRFPKLRHLLLPPISIRPNAGPDDRPVLPSMQDGGK